MSNAITPPKCAHCEGTGTCKAASGLSCDACRLSEAKELGVDDSKITSVVPCSKCKGYGYPDFRRVTQVQASGLSYAVKILVFSSRQIGRPLEDIVAAPWLNGVRAVLNTGISR